VATLAAAMCVMAFVAAAATPSASASTSTREGSTARFGVEMPGRAKTLPGVSRIGSMGLPSTSVSIRLSGSPGVPVANPKTDTIYVPIQCATSGCPSSSKAGHVVDVINAADCNATVTSHCRVVAKAKVGSYPLAATVDEQTDTVYVVNGSGSVSVVNGARCNATVTRGCGRSLATVKTGGFPVAAAFDPRTRTLYAASPSGEVFVINGARCNAVTTKGCGQPVKTVKDNLDPDAIDVDLATDTVYAANAGPSNNGDTLSVIDGATCNGTNGTGCARIPPTTKVGNNPFWDVVDQATNTIYVANTSDTTVSVVNGATCNAKIASGCGRASPVVSTGAGPSFVGIDSPLHTLFTLNSADDTLSEINTKDCDGAVRTGCPKTARNVQAPIPPGGYGPGTFAFMAKTATAYLVNTGGQSSLSVMNASSCNATDVSGCRVEAPSVPDHEYVLSYDRATDTLYASNDILPQIDVFNAATCDPKHLSACAPVAVIPVPADVGAIDDSTHTLYASEYQTSSTSVDRVYVIDTATCNAGDTSGCKRAPATVTVGPSPGPPAINVATHTLYVPFGAAANQIAVVDTAACNARDSSGCDQKPGVVTVGAGTFGNPVIAVSTKTDTIYASIGNNTVAVVDGTTCNGTNHSGCSHVAATVKVGIDPYGVAVDDATHTVYVVNNTNGDSPGTVSIINGRTCNGSDTLGCKGQMPIAVVGRSPLLATLDPATDTLYVGDFSSAAVSVVNGSTCKATVTTTCDKAAPMQAVGSQPWGLAVNPRSNTVYVAAISYDATDVSRSGPMSIFRGARSR
jgi:DNA-binding beta-propeller fold protein YncE